MAIEGRLEEIGLADICQLLSMGRKTGCLTLREESNFGYVYLEEGRVIYAMVLNRPDRLGEVLVRSGVISRKDLAAAIDEHVRHPGRRLGEILVAQGKVSEEDLRRFVSFQIQEAFYHLFEWEAGTFHFEPNRRPTEHGTLLVSMSTEGLLLEGARRIDEWSLIEKKVPSMDLIFKLDREPGTDGENDGEDRGVELTEEQKVVLELLDGTRTVDDIVLDSGLMAFDVAKAIYGLVQAGFASTEGEHREEAEEGKAPAPHHELEVAAAYYRAGMLDDAESQYRTLLESNPQNAVALDRLATIALRTGRAAEAIECLDALPESARTSATLRNRALALELLDRFDEALEVLEAASELEPGDAGVALAKGILLLKSGKPAEALDALREYRQLNGPGQDASSMYFAYGILAAAAAGDTRQALRIGKEGLTRYPANCAILVNLGAVLERVGELDASEGLYLRAVQRSPTPPQAHKNLGDLAYRRGDQAGARAHYERALKLDEALGDDTYLKLGELAYKEGETAEAAELWQRALELNPQNEVVRTNLALVTTAGDS